MTDLINEWIIKGLVSVFNSDTKAEQQPTTTDGKHNIKVITHQDSQRGSKDTILLYYFISCFILFLMCYNGIVE